MAKANIRYIVDDVEAAVTFYTTHLDFELKMHPAPGFAALENNQIRLNLNEPGAGGAGTAVNGKQPKPGGWNRIQLKVKEIEAEFKKLKKLGATFRNKITEGKGGKQVLLEDPSGNPIELFEPFKQKVHPIPEGFHTITPYLLLKDAAGLLNFMQQAFDADVMYRTDDEEGRILHCTVKIGDSMLMLSGVTDRIKPMPCMLHLYVKEVDVVYRQAVDAGGKSLREPENQFYGDRSAGIKDMWGNQWWIATHIQDAVEEKEERKDI